MFLMLFLIFSCLTQAWATIQMSKPGCPTRCGETDIPYPFGIGPGCSQNPWFEIDCDESFNPPKPFLSRTNDPVLDISLKGRIRIENLIAYDCHNEDGYRGIESSVWHDYTEAPYSFSSTHNKLTAIGCNTRANIVSFNEQDVLTGCESVCNDTESVKDGSCSGVGCCQTSIKQGLKLFNVKLDNYYNDRRTSIYGRCSYAFLVDETWFKFFKNNISNFRSVKRVPAVMNWVINEMNCEEARKSAENYACKENSQCYNSSDGLGHLCKCSKGFEGNPYLENGCRDIDECSDPRTNPCEGICTNLEGSFHCSCPNGTHGDGRRHGMGCIKDNPHYDVRSITLGTGLGLSFILLGASCLYFGVRKKRQTQLKYISFRDNGGILLQTKMASPRGVAAVHVKSKILFTEEELRKATNNYDKSKIIGYGDNGRIYKGILSDKTKVVIKKARIADRSEIKEFIDDVYALSSINHKNIAKLIGCCLETEIPLLVYEYVAHGTLFNHIHAEGTPSLSWKDRLRIAAEISGALAYLHCDVSIPIIHRNIKSANILLDENYAAKISDLGIFRSVPFDHDNVIRFVQRTLGYLDPEYFHSSTLTEKSDVYSFGVLLVELLTSEMPISNERIPEERKLSNYFIACMLENNLMQIVDLRVLQEGSKEQVQAVAELAMRCLNLKREERPSMKEVAIELEGLRTFEKLSWVLQTPEEKNQRPTDPANLDNNRRVGREILKHHNIMKLDIPR